MSDAHAPPTFEELLRHADWLRGLARAVVRDDAVAEDLVQETWLSALRTPPRSRGSIRSWLRQVLKRHAYQRYRAEVARAGREKAAARPDASPGTAALVSRTEVQSRVLRAVLDLDEPYRATVLLRYVEDLPPREVAARLDVPVETVRARLRRARERLRERLDREDGREGAWLGALLPLVVPTQGEAASTTLATTTTGVLVMTTTQKMATAAAAAAVLAAGLVLLAPDGDGGDSRDADTTAEAAAAPDVQERSRVRVTSEPTADVGGVPDVPDTASSTEDGPDAPARVRVHVRVLPPVDGAAPQSVRLHVRRERPSPVMALPEREVRPGAEVDVDVSSLLPDAEPARIVVLADHPDFLPVGDRLSYASPNVRARTDESIDLPLRPAIRISGRVLDASGRPVDDATIGTFLPQEGKQPHLLLDRTVTDAAGRFSVRSMPGADVQLAAATGRHIPAVHGVAGAAVSSAIEDIVLADGATLRVRVLADGEPTSESLDFALHAGYGSALALGSRRGADVLDDGSVSRLSPRGTSSEGLLVVPGLLARPHRLTPRVPDAAPGVEEALVREVTPGAPDLVLDLALSRVTVLVTDDTRPLPGVDVIVRLPDRGGTARFTTGEDGRVRMRTLRGAAYTVEVDHEAWTRAPQRVDVPEGAREHSVRIVATRAR